MPADSWLRACSKLARKSSYVWYGRGTASHRDRRNSQPFLLAIAYFVVLLLLLVLPVQPTNYPSIDSFVVYLQWTTEWLLRLFDGTWIDSGSEEREGCTNRTVRPLALAAYHKDQSFVRDCAGWHCLLTKRFLVVSRKRSCWMFVVVPAESWIILLFFCHSYRVLVMAVACVLLPVSDCLSLFLLSTPVPHVVLVDHEWP